MYQISTTTRCSDSHYARDITRTNDSSKRMYSTKYKKALSYSELNERDAITTVASTLSQNWALKLKL